MSVQSNRGLVSGFLCIILLFVLTVPQAAAAAAARTPGEVVAAMGAAATSGDDIGFLAAFDPRSREVLRTLATSGDAWQRAEDAFVRAFAEKFGETLSPEEGTYGVPQRFVRAAAGERGERPPFLERYMSEIVAIEVVRVEQVSSDARVYVKTTVRQAGSRPRVQEDVLSVHRRGGVWRVSLPFLPAMSDETARVERSRTAIVEATRDLRAGRIGERYLALEARRQSFRLLNSTPPASR
jgi:hypothetical protein